MIDPDDVILMRLPGRSNSGVTYATRLVASSPVSLLFRLSIGIIDGRAGLPQLVPFCPPVASLHYSPILVVETDLN